MVLPRVALSQTADTVRIATFAAPLSREGPGLLLRDIRNGDDPQIVAVSAIIDQTSPDILLLTNIDFDAGAAAISAFSQQLADPFPYVFSTRPNAGVQTGLDVDGNGFSGDARDALGYGRFMGDGGMAVLSRFPILRDSVVDLTATLWRDVPGAVLPALNGGAFPSPQVHSILPVSSTGHWVVPVALGQQTITLLAFSATAPVFDGPEDFNGLRNRDELRLFEAVLNGEILPPPDNPVLIGNINADPFDGQGLRDGIAGVLARSDLQDPAPQSAGARAVGDQSHSAFDTADWADDGAGNLRVSYVLPASALRVVGAGVFWPAPDDPLFALLGEDGLAAGPHRLVWVDIEVETVP